MRAAKNHFTSENSQNNPRRGGAASPHGQRPENLRQVRQPGGSNDAARRKRIAQFLKEYWGVKSGGNGSNQYKQTGQNVQVAKKDKRYSGDRRSKDKMPLKTIDDIAETFGETERNTKHGINQYGRVRQNGGSRASGQNGHLKSISRDIGELKMALINIGLDKMGNPQKSRQIQKNQKDKMELRLRI